MATTEPTRRVSLGPLLALCFVGVAIRGVAAWLAGDVEYQSDEANYLYLAISWNRFGFYSDCFRYLWPPGYPWILAKALALFGMGGVFAVKVLQVLGSASIGMTTMLFAGRMFGSRAAWIAGVVWCLYLPLIGFTHYLWTETLFLALFLPSLYLVFRALDDADARPEARLIGAGLLLAGALYVKEVPLYLSFLLALVLTFGSRGVSRSEGLRRGALYLLAMAAAVAPWTLRNLEVYGRLVPVGTSLGENFYGGVNAEYKNFDARPFNRFLYFEGRPPEARVRPWFVAIDPESGWERAEEINNTPDRLDENVRRGIAFAAAHPAWFVRSRIAKLADLFAPTSFVLRHAALGHYRDGPLGASGIRHAMIVVAGLSPVLLLLLAPVGLFGALRNARARLFLLVVIGYFTATGLLVAMSRFRIPFVPLLIVLAAGGLAHGVRNRGTAALAGIGLSWALLAFLWWVDLPATLAIVEFGWRPGR